VRELCEYVFKQLDLFYLDYIEINEKHLRPEELRDLKGDASKIKKELGWSPKYTFEGMLDEMIEYWIDYYGQLGVKKEINTIKNKNDA